MLLFFQAPQVNSTYNETKDVPDVTSLLISWFIFLFCLFFQLCALSLFALLWQLSLKPLPVLVNHVFILLVKKKTSYVNDRSTADITDYAGYIHTIVVFQKIPIPLLQYIFMLPEKENYSVLLHANIAAASARVLFFGNSVSVTQDQSGGEVVCVLHAKAWPS